MRALPGVLAQRDVRQFPCAVATRKVSCLGFPGQQRLCLARAERQQLRQPEHGGGAAGDPCCARATGLPGRRKRNYGHGHQRISRAFGAVASVLGVLWCRDPVRRAAQARDCDRISEEPKASQTGQRRELDLNPRFRLVQEVRAAGPTGLAARTERTWSRDGGLQGARTFARSDPHSAPRRRSGRSGACRGGPVRTRRHNPPAAVGERLQRRGTPPGCAALC